MLGVLLSFWVARNKGFMWIKPKLVSVVCGTATVFSASVVGISATRLENSTTKKEISNSLIAFLKDNVKLKNVLLLITVVGIAVVVRFCFRYVVNKEIFFVDKSESTHLVGNGIISDSIEINGLRGRNLKLKNPTSKELEGKCVLIFLGNDVSINDVLDSLVKYEKEETSKQSTYQYKPLKVLLDKGATLVGADYRGTGNSDPVSKLSNMEKILYKDGEKIYDCVNGELGYESENIIFWAHSIGGPVAAHALAHATKGNKKSGGLILASPIPSLYEGVSRSGYSKSLGLIAKMGSGYNLNTEENLSKVENKDVPIFICSGDSEDKFSIEETKLDEKITKMGFKNVKTNISEKCWHGNLCKMFFPGYDKESEYTNYIENSLANGS